MSVDNEFNVMEDVEFKEVIIHYERTYLTEWCNPSLTKTEEKITKKVIHINNFQHIITEYLNQS